MERQKSRPSCCGGWSNFKMLRIRFLQVVVVCLFVCFSVFPGYAQYDFRLDQVFGGQWHDAEKSRANTEDDWLCWAASAANVLVWTGWGTAVGFADVDSIMEYYADHWNDHPAGSPREAWRWWFTGETMGKAGAKVVKPGGAFWPAIPFPVEKWRSSRGDLLRGIGQTELRKDPYILRNLLEEAYGVALQIVRPRQAGDRDSHIVTLWGFRSNATNRFQGIFITDSDDDKDSKSAQRAPDRLVYYPVILQDGSWWLEYKGEQWKILAAYALQRKDRQD